MLPRNIDLESARLFLIAHEEGNLTRAADRANISLSAVTKRIQDLELRFDVALFERHPRGVRVTAAGEELARQVRLVFGQLDTLVAAMEQFSSGVRGHVSVISSQSAIVGGLAAFTAQFMREHPQITVELRELPGWSIMAEIRNGQADFGLSVSDLEVPEMIAAAPYRPVPLVAAMREDHPLAGQSAVTFADLVDHDHITLGPKSALSALLTEQAAALGRTFRFRVARSYDVMRSMVSAGLGIGILSEILVAPHAAALGLRCLPIRESWAERMLCIYHRPDALTPAGRLYLAELLKAEGAAS